MNSECCICYEIITNINVSITSCNHKFHTNCLLRCGNVCPLCRTNVALNKPTKSHLIPNGRYTPNAYLEQMRIHNISLDEVNPEIKEWLEEFENDQKEEKEKEKRQEEQEEERKQYIRRTDKAKYDLFYGHK